MSFFSATKTETMEKLKTWCTAFIAMMTACGIIVTPIAVWAVSEIEDIAVKTLEARAPAIVDVRMNEVFDGAYKTGFSELDGRTRGIERNQLDFKYKLREYERDAIARDKLQQEKLKGINDKLELLLEQMRRNNRP